jgi:hypothetical protein
MERETLEPTGLEERLPQLSIVNEGSGDSAADIEGDAAPKGRRAPMIVEISEDGSFELPDGGDEEEEEEEEPPSLEEGGAAPQGGAAGAGAADAGPTLMDEMLAAANTARAETKNKAKAEEKRVKKEFGKGLKGGFFNKPKAAKPKRKVATKKVRSETESCPISFARKQLSPHLPTSSAGCCGGEADRDAQTAAADKTGGSARAG